MKSTIAKRDHIERHHGRQHAPPQQFFAQHRDIADTVPASPKIRGSSESVNASAAMFRSKFPKPVSRSPLPSISWITRARASKATRRPETAYMPPTKQPMLPAPATPIGRFEIIFAFQRCRLGSIAEFRVPNL